MAECIKYISRQDTLDYIENEYCMDCEHSDGVLCKDCHYEDCMDIIRAMPAADVQPIRRGKWEEIERYGGWGGTYFRCSICGDEWDLDIGTTVVKGMKYCSNCGARMDGDK